MFSPAMAKRNGELQATSWWHKSLFFFACLRCRRRRRSRCSSDFLNRRKIIAISKGINPSVSHLKWIIDGGDLLKHIPASADDTTEIDFPLFTLLPCVCYFLSFFLSCELYLNIKRYARTTKQHRMRSINKFHIHLFIHSLIVRRSGN